MSGDVSLSAEQNPRRPAEVLASAPDPFLDHCLYSSLYLSLSDRAAEHFRQSCTPTRCHQDSTGVSVQAALHAAYSFNILSHLPAGVFAAAVVLLHWQIIGTKLFPRADEMADTRAWQNHVVSSSLHRKFLTMKCNSAWLDKSAVWKYLKIHLIHQSWNILFCLGCNLEQCWQTWWKVHSGQAIQILH